MDKFRVEFYVTPNGEEPAREFLDELDPKMRTKMFRTINMLAKNGSDLRPPYSEKLDKHIFELRAKVGSDISRVLYFFFVDRRIVLTHGFIKKTQKTPPRELERARKYYQEYMKKRS